MHEKMKENRKSEIPFAIPQLGDKEKEGLCGVIDSGWITMGEKVARFEKAFSELHGQEEAVAVNSCTAGLHLCLRALDVGPGDEVMVPSLTFVATVNAVLYVDATPIFLDIQSIDMPHISIEEAEAKYTPRTKAVVVMHYGGYPVDLLEWRSFCDTKKMMLIEDAAHAPGIDGVARLSDASVFSFFSNKNITTAEGGMVMARDPSVVEKIRRLRGHAMSTDTLARDRGHAYSYDVTMLGYNYRMDELRAVMGLVQLSRLLDWNEKRRELSKIYRKRLLALIPDVVIPFDQGDETAAHLMPILLPPKARREKVMKQLRDVGIQTSIHYPPIHLFSYYRERFPDIILPKTEEFCKRELTLPLHPLLTKNDIAYVVDHLKKAVEQSTI